MMLTLPSTPQGRKLIANIDAREGPVLHLRLIDPSDAGSPTDSINAQLVREGLAVVDRKGCKYISSYPQILKRLQDDTAEAKRSRSGMYEFGTWGVFFHILPQSTKLTASCR